jgi:hypothetical protein
MNNNQKFLTILTLVFFVALTSCALVKTAYSGGGIPLIFTRHNSTYLSPEAATSFVFAVVYVALFFVFKRAVIRQTEAADDSSQANQQYRS